jgi:hypothetical protein
VETVRSGIANVQDQDMSAAVVACYGQVPKSNS